MGKKLLVADDSITIQKVVELILSEEGFDIKSVSNGEDALNAIKTESPDIVLADIEMPKINGYELCERLKSDPSTKDIPVILLAGAFENFDEKMAQDVGADSYVVKPFESQELINKIHSVMEAPAKPLVEEELAAVAEEEDLWSLEDITEAQAVETAEAEEIAVAEEVPAEVTSLEPEAQVAEEEVLEEAIGTTSAEAQEAFAVQVEEAPAEEYRMPGISREEVTGIILGILPKKEEITAQVEALFEKIAKDIAAQNEKVIKEALATVAGQAIRESIEAVLWEILPDLSERMMRDIFESRITLDIKGSIEKIAWEVIPDLAENLITREIEKIKAE